MKVYAQNLLGYNQEKTHSNGPQTSGLLRNRCVFDSPPKPWLAVLLALFTAPRHPLWLYIAGALEAYVSILRCAFCVSDENGLSHLMSALCFFPLFLPSTASPSLVSSKYRKPPREHLNVALFPFTRFVRTVFFDSFFWLWLYLFGLSSIIHYVAIDVQKFCLKIYSIVYCYFGFNLSFDILKNKTSWSPVWMQRYDADLRKGKLDFLNMTIHWFLWKCDNTTAPNQLSHSMMDSLVKKSIRVSTANIRIQSLEYYMMNPLGLAQR